MHEEPFLALVAPVKPPNLLEDKAALLGNTWELKEAGLLVLINQHIARRHGVFPLGEEFNVRTAPRDHQALLQLAEERLPMEWMPRLVGVGDTVTSTQAADGHSWLRGGSDRGFLTLLKDLGASSHQPNRVIMVDSSHGEVDRPSLADGRLLGISDPQDPLELDVLMPGGPADYINGFRPWRSVDGLAVMPFPRRPDLQQERHLADRGSATAHPDRVFMTPRPFSGNDQTRLGGMIRQKGGQESFVPDEAFEIAEQHPIGGFHQFKLAIRPDAVDDAHIGESHLPINAFVGGWRHLSGVGEGVQASDEHPQILLKLSRE